MNDRDPLTRLLGTPGDDAGCEGGMALLAVYVEEELAGRNVRDLFPTVAEHLRNCRPRRGLPGPDRARPRPPRLRLDGAPRAAALAHSDRP